MSIDSVLFIDPNDSMTNFSAQDIARALNEEGYEASPSLFRKGRFPDADEIAQARAAVLYPAAGIVEYHAFASSLTTAIEAYLDNHQTSGPYANTYAQLWDHLINILPRAEGKPASHIRYFMPLQKRRKPHAQVMIRGQWLPLCGEQSHAGVMPDEKTYSFEPYDNQCGFCSTADSMLRGTYALTFSSLMTYPDARAAGWLSALGLKVDRRLFALAEKAYMQNGKRMPGHGSANNQDYALARPDARGSVRYPKPPSGQLSLF